MNKNRMYLKVISLFVVLSFLFIVSCQDEEPSKHNTIYGFSINGIAGTITQAEDGTFSINVELLYGTDLTSLAAEVQTGGGKITPNPEEERDYTGAVTFLVVAENEEDKVYRVKVTEKNPVFFVESYAKNISLDRVGPGDFTKEDLFKVTGLANASKYTLSFLDESDAVLKEETLTAVNESIASSLFTFEQWQGMEDGLPSTVKMDIRLLNRSKDDETLEHQEVDIINVTSEVVYVKEQTKIRTWQDLQAINTTDLTLSYTIENDIAFPFPGKDGFPEEGFIPIGSEASPFTGKINGQFKTIENLYIYQPGNDNVGLIGVANKTVASGEMSNLYGIHLRDAKITGRNFVGGYVGKLVEGQMENCYVQNIEVRGTMNVGGIAGRLDGGTAVSKCFAKSGLIVGESRVGGLAGANNGQVAQSFSDVAVNADQNFAGGLAGRMDGGEVYNSYARGRVVAVTSLGGIVGEMQGNSKIEKSYSTGYISLKEGESSLIGGMVGVYQGAGTSVVGSFYDVTLSNQAVSDEPSKKGVGYTTPTMLDSRTYETDAKWDMATIWDIESNANDGYPYLRALPQ